MTAPVVLVFGAGGQLGLELQGRAKSPSLSFHFLSRAESDIASSDEVTRALARPGVALVVNAAAYTAVDQAEDERAQAFRANETGPRILAQACAASGVPLVHLSTDYVFDGRKAGAYVETDATAPINVYGRSKLAGEIAIVDALNEHLILRTSWVFGAYGRNFLKTMLKFAAERDELRVVTDQHGCPTSTADLADAIIGIAPRLIAYEPVWGIYHFASLQPTTWHSFASAIIEAQAKTTGRRPAVISIGTKDYKTKAVRPQNSVLDSTKFLSVFRMKAKSWQQRVGEAVAALQAKAGAV